jgi:hypothetical protein
VDGGGLGIVDTVPTSAPDVVSPTSTLCAEGRTDVTDPRLRASDADRERVVAALQKHTAAGRLNLDEFGERVSRALAAVTHADLAAVTVDLPADKPTPPGAAAGGRSSQLLVALLAAVLTLVVLGVIFALGR